MPYFLNVFDQEFRGSWILGDRQYVTNFNIGPNVNTSTQMMAWTAGPYNLSTDTDLTINYAIDPTQRQFQTIVVDVSGTTASATKATEVAALLNANSVFASLWTANARSLSRDPNVMTVQFQAKRSNIEIRAYIANTGAEEHLHFNAKAKIAQLPTYFRRHTIANVLTYDDSFGMLIELDTGDTYTQSMITAAGQDYTTVLEDWELLRGRSGLFLFKNITYDGSSRITDMIEYHAGAVAGDLAMLTRYQYTGAATSPSIITMEPYTLDGGDLVTPA